MVMVTCLALRLVALATPEPSAVIVAVNPSDFKYAATACARFAASNVLPVLGPKPTTDTFTTEPLPAFANTAFTAACDFFVNVVDPGMNVTTPDACFVATCDTAVPVTCTPSDNDRTSRIGLYPFACNVRGPDAMPSGIVT